MRQKSRCKGQRSVGAKLLTRSIRQRANGIKLCALCSMLFALCLMLLAFFGCATTTGNVKDSIAPKEVTVVTGIDIQDNTLTITANKPFIYTIYRSSDPYKMIIDLPDVTIGTFNNKIVSNRAGITEIVPFQIESPSVMARFEMLVQTPQIVEQEYKNKVLIVRIKEETGDRSQETEVRSEEEISEPPAAEQKPLPKATEISGISFEKSVDTVNVLIKGNGFMMPNVFPLEDRIVIDIPDVVLNAPLPSAVISPVKGIRSGKHSGKMRLILDLKEKTNFDVSANGDSVVIALKGPGKEPPALHTGKVPDERIEAVTKTAEAEETDAVEDGKYTGKKISLDFQDSDIVPIFRLLADISGYNMVVSPEVKGKLTMKLINVPWDQALDIILKTFGIGKSIEGNIIRIAPYTVFAKESEEAAKAREAGVKAEPLETKIFPISYADVSVVEASVKNSKILTPRGNISADKRTSSVLIKDVASVFPEVENVLATLDRPTPQVLIEARIVEVNISDVTNLGIQWGLKLNSTDTLFSAGGLSSLGRGTFTGNSFLVDFPSGASGAGSGSGFNFGILNPAKTIGLDLQLDALEKIGRSKIISNPKVVTTDNEMATIMQGTSEPFPKLTTEGTISTEYKDVVLSTEVTPHITPAGSISMSIHVKKEDVKELRNIGGSQVPVTTKIDGNTKVLVQNGETVVIGGVYKKIERTSFSGVPGLMNIPVLGWLFKNKSITEDTSELLIFITPRIVQKP